MYAQVTVIASYDAVKLRQALIAQVGPTRITPLAALARTVLARNAREIAPAVVVAQSIRTAVTILYFFDGPSSISIHIKAPTLVGLKAHIARVALELLSELPQGRKIIEAELFTQTARGEALH